MQIPSSDVLTSWPQSDNFDPVTRGLANTIVSSVLYCIVCIFLLLRIFTRLRLSKSFGVDDTLLLLAWIPTTTFFVVSLVINHHFHWNRHQYDIPSDDIVTGLKIVLTIQVVFAFAVTFIKLSMLALTQRITSVCASSLWYKITTAAIVLVSIQGMVFCFAVIFQCRPLSTYWSLSPTRSDACIDQTSTLLAAGVINTMTDLLVVMLPLHIVWSLKLPTGQRIFIKVLFAIGFCSCAAGIVRTYFMYQTTTSQDQTWEGYPVWITSGIELYLGMICTTIPATKPFFSSYLPSLFSSNLSLHPTTSSGSRLDGSHSRPNTIDAEEVTIQSKESLEIVVYFS